MLANVAAALQRELTRRNLASAPPALVARLPSWDAPVDEIEITPVSCPANLSGGWWTPSNADNGRLICVSVRPGCLELQGSDEVQDSGSKQRYGVNSFIHCCRKIDAWSALTDAEWTAYCTAKSTSASVSLMVDARTTTYASCMTGAWIMLAAKYADEPGTALNQHLFSQTRKPM
jgi:hypothetical protein